MDKYSHVCGSTFSSPTKAFEPFEVQLTSLPLLGVLEVRRGQWIPWNGVIDAITWLLGVTPGPLHEHYG